MNLQDLPASFEEILLTTEEQELVLKEAILAKWRKVEDRRKQLEEKQKREDKARALHSVTSFWDYVMKRGDRLVQLQTGNPAATFRKIKYQEHVVKALAMYFCNSPEFEKLNHRDFSKGGQPFSLQKGLFIFGPPGVGKTLLMEMFQFNPRLSYNIIQCSKLATLISQEGEKVMNAICKEVPNGSLFPSVGLGEHKKITGICFNDLGTEKIPIAYYANKTNVMQDIILNTYDNKVPFWQRYITTNNTAEQLKEMYGVRVTDRMRQMYNIIDIIGESIR